MIGIVVVIAPRDTFSALALPLPPAGGAILVVVQVNLAVQEVQEAPEVC